jgi:predicted HicB family RNase H-like nuclease
MMKYKGYLGRVEFDGEAKLLHGEVVGIRDVVTFQANSANQVEKAFRDSVDDYLSFCAQRGEKPDKPASGKFIARIPVSLHRQLSMLADYHGKSLNALVEQFLQKEVEQQLNRLEPRQARSSQSRRHRRAG